MDYVRVPKNKSPRPGLNVGVIMGNRKVSGQVGLEIEVEGKSLPRDGEIVASTWQYHEDGSLRGQENAEYVLTKPLPFDKVNAALKSLWLSFKKKGATIDDSNRTSVHVHLNVQDFFLNRLTSFMGLYFALEELLTEWCGETRVGNLFCLRAIDAPAIVVWAKRYVQSDGQAQLPETLHYAAFNMQALKKFGSIEIRTMRGVNDPEIIKNWVGILQRLYDLSEEIIDPREVPAMVSSGGGAVAFFDKVLGEHASIVRNGIDATDERIRTSVYRGIRLAQDICYCRDWNLYKPMELKDDPFSRNIKSIGRRLANNPPSFPPSAAVAGPGVITVPYATENEYTEEPEPEYNPDPWYEGEGDGNYY